MSACLALEQRLSVAYLGPAGTFSHSAVTRHFGEFVSADGSTVVRLGAGETQRFTLSLRMGGCESLSARAGAFVTRAVVRTQQAGVFDDDVTITLPEEVHTGSPREAFCPRSTATSRPPG